MQTPAVHRSQDVAVSLLRHGAWVSLPAETVELLAGRRKISDIRGGSIVYTEADVERFGVLVQDLLRVYMHASDGRQVTVRYVRPGGLLGAPAFRWSPRNERGESWLGQSAVAGEEGYDRFTASECVIGPMCPSCSTVITSTPGSVAINNRATPSAAGVERVPTASNECPPSESADDEPDRPEEPQPVVANTMRASRAAP